MTEPSPLVKSRKNWVYRKSEIAICTPDPVLAPSCALIELEMRCFTAATRLYASIYRLAKKKFVRSKIW